MAAPITTPCRCSPGLHVFKADGPVCDKLAEVGALLAKGKLVHSYPHSWRSKAPLIFRNTPQWFISMSQDGLRDKALAAIDDTRFVPDRGRNRIRGMVETRPDWVISRQRAWGVPITVFVEKATGKVLQDEAVNARIVEAFEAEGADAWFSSPPSRFLGNERNPEDYEKVDDVLDVWFDSGSTHAFVLESGTWPDLSWPASLYLEGSDQHRGWFQSSLLESVGTRGRAPYDAILTHGFILTADGHKMSKSLGNDIAPQKIVDQYGADILRLWVVGDRLHRGRAHRRGNPQRPGRCLPENPQYLALSSRQSRRIRRSRKAAPAPTCRSWNAGCCIA